MKGRLFTYGGMYFVLVGAALPLVFGLVPPNRWFGFRLPGTAHSPTLWYEINELGGKFFIASMVICVVLNLVFLLPGMERIHPYMGWINALLIPLSFWIVTQALIPYLP